MQETKVNPGASSVPDRARSAGFNGWRALSRSLGFRLMLLLAAAMVMTFAVLGYESVQLHQRSLEENTLYAAERISDMIKRGTSYDMLHNDRPALAQSISDIARDPGVVKIRIIGPQGLIAFSSQHVEVGRSVDLSSDSCTGCHERGTPEVATLHPPRFRIFRQDGARVLGIITPIENGPSCYNAACHAHKAEQKVLGVLDTNLSLATADRQLAEDKRHLLASTVLAAAIICILAWLLVWNFVYKPVAKLKAGTDRLAQGELGLQLAINSSNEIGELANSFNSMSLQLRKANEDLTSWAKVLEERINEKTSELKCVYDQVLQVEKMTSLGKMAAVVAHEINNPLAGILTYAKLMKRWLAKRELSEARLREVEECLDLIESESKRCGELVKNLLAFSRTSPINLEWTDLNTVVDRTLKLVQYQFELKGIHVLSELDPHSPPVHCDPSQIEQLLLALVMNSIDAMPRGGNLWITTLWRPQARELALQVRDDGSGIPADVLSRLFEPFMTTKESGKGVGLGLAISRRIVETHKGTIRVESEVGRGTTFHIVLPQRAGASAAAEGESALAAKVR